MHNKLIAHLLCLDTPGTTILTYTPDGRRIVTAGSNSAIRIYTSGQDGEPTTIDEGIEGHFGIAATV
jgi:chromosome transmission fidelity protein 4